MSAFFDRVVCISLKRREDRRRRIRKLAKATKWPFAPIEFFDAIDGSVVPTGMGFISGGGAWGCRQSWTRVLEQAMSDGINTLLVLEDDAVWRDDFATESIKFLNELPADWQVAYLGGQNMGTPARVSEYVGRVRNCQRTHAIAMNRDGMRFAYGIMSTADRHIDHLFGPACGRHRKCYQATPFLIGQDATKSDISGRKDHARFWTPPEKAYPVLWLCATQEVAELLTEYGIHYGFDLDARGIDRGLTNIFPRKGVVRSGLGKFLSTVAWESASFFDAPGITTVWHPNADDEAYEIAKSSLPDRAVKSPFFDDIDDAVVWLREHFGHNLIRKRSDRKRLPVVLVRSPSHVVEALREASVVHFGRWLDDETKIDRGLIQHFKNGGGSLADWYRVLEREAKEINAPVGVWHPKATVEDCTTTGREVVVVDSISPDEALKQIEGAIDD